jgi:4-diphosphocytidyl-2-C-methyl-D-erythritol kinase
VTGAGKGARIHLTKQIPIAAGLGGGSSDAAATLLGLNELWGLGLSPPRLLDVAARIGADVPFFLWQVPFALARGRGDQCDPLAAPLPTVWHVLVVPNVQLLTKEIYDSFDVSYENSDLTPAVPSITMTVHALRNGSLCELAKGLWNDLEPEAIRRCPLIRITQSQLRAAGCLSARVSGSGPAVFGLCQDHAHAETVAHQLNRRNTEGWFIRVIHTEQSVDGTQAPGEGREERHVSR